MQLGIDTFSYHLALEWGAMDLFAFIDQAHALGLDVVKINTGHLGAMDPGRLRELGEHAQAAGLFVEVDTRGTATGHLRKILTVCQALNADVLRTYASVGGNVADELVQARHDLRAIEPLCADLGIRIALENHEYETAAEVVQVIESVNSEWVGLLVDTGNSMPLWEDPLAAVRTMAPYAVSTHFKDQAVILENDTPLIVGVPLGQGSIDCAACFQLLAKSSPLKRISIQVCYGYSSPFRTTQEQGHGGRLGEGAFRILPPPHDPSCIVPHPHTMPVSRREQLIAWQRQAVVESLAFVRNLHAQFCA